MVKSMATKEARNRANRNYYDKHKLAVQYVNSRSQARGFVEATGKKAGYRYFDSYLADLKDLRVRLDRRIKEEEGKLKNETN